jgi:hypothetical protein
MNAADPGGSICHNYYILLVLAFQGPRIKSFNSLGKDSPENRSISHTPNHSSAISSLPSVGGLHHCYDWQQAA